MAPTKLWLWPGVDVDPFVVVVCILLLQEGSVARLKPTKERVNALHAEERENAENALKFGIVADVA